MWKFKFLPPAALTRGLTSPLDPCYKRNSGEHQALCRSQSTVDVRHHKVPLQDLGGCSGSQPWHKPPCKGRESFNIWGLKVESTHLQLYVAVQWGFSGLQYGTCMACVILCECAKTDTNRHLNIKFSSVHFHPVQTQDKDDLNCGKEFSSAFF